jgi:hypothetical protein
MNSDNEEEDERTMPVCFTPEEISVLEEFAKRNGMTSCSQAVEFIAQQNIQR